MIQEETWVSVNDYDGYELSNLGKVRGLDRFNTDKSGRRYFKKAMYLNETTHRQGYKYYRLYKNGKSYKIYTHRLIAEHFIPNPENKKEVNHIDGDKSNNSISNLEWVTPSENMYHSFKTGLRKPKYGIDHPTSFLILDLYTGIFYGSKKELVESNGKYKCLASISLLIDRNPDRYKIC